jgi:hypothetical protein
MNHSTPFSTFTKKTLKLYKLVGLLIALILVVFGIILILSNSKKTVIPNNIRSEVNFPIFYPSGLKNAVIDQSSLKYDSKQKYVNYLVNYNKFKLTFSEQATPNTFTVDPSIYTEFTQKFNIYGSFSSVNGNVNLGQPAHTAYEVAIMNSSGTLLFIRTDNGYMDESNWRLLFNNLAYVRPD